MWFKNLGGKLKDSVFLLEDRVGTGGRGGGGIEVGVVGKAEEVGWKDELDMDDGDVERGDVDKEVVRIGGDRRIGLKGPEMEGRGGDGDVVNGEFERKAAALGECCCPTKSAMSISSFPGDGNSPAAPNPMGTNDVPKRGGLVCLLGSSALVPLLPPSKLTPPPVEVIEFKFEVDAENNPEIAIGGGGAERSCD